MTLSVTNVSPLPSAIDVVLGTSLLVTFSGPINVDSFNNATFALTGPNLSSIVSPQQLIEFNPQPAQGRGYILGTFSFSTLTYLPWVAGTAYHIGNQIIDSNSNVQTATINGVSCPYAPAWQSTEGDSTIDNNVPIWQALDAYTFGQYILDPNGNLQKATVVVGPSGATIPTFNATLSGTTPDGGITWTNYGPIVGPIEWTNGGPANSGVTIATFTPAHPLLSGQIYTALVVGADSVLSDQYVEDTSGNPLASSYQWSFTTGTLPLNTPPIQNPIPPPKTFINPNCIQVIPRAAVGNDITVVDIIFPQPIDTNSFNSQDLLIGIEPILNDPCIMVPPGASASYVVQGNKLIVTVTGVGS